MLKKTSKSIFKSDNKLYKILSYVYNYSDRNYLPRRINTIDIIIEALSKAQQSVVFVQVGSNDGVSGDPLHSFINAYDWKGVLIEPVPFLYEKLKANYIHHKGGLHFLNIAVSNDNDAYKTFYSIDEKHRGEVPDWYFQLGSFKKEVLCHHQIPNIDFYITSQKVPVSSIQNIIDTYIKGNLDFLHIDTEGFDFEILKTLDFNKTAPKIILIEYIHLDVADRKNMINLLKSHKYIIYRCNYDFICLLKSFHDLYFKSTLKFPFWE